MSFNKQPKLESHGIYKIWGNLIELRRCQELTNKGVQCKDKACKGTSYCGKYYAKTFSDSESDSDSRSEESDSNGDENGNLDGFVNYTEESSDSDSYDEDNDESLKKSFHKLTNTSDNFLKRPCDFTDQNPNKKTRSGSTF